MKTKPFLYVYLDIYTIPLCAHAFSFFMPTYEQMRLACLKNWPFFCHSIELIYNRVRYLGMNTEPKPRETCRKWCQDVSENNSDNSAIFWPRWEQLLMSSALSSFSLTFPIPETCHSTGRHLYSSQYFSFFHNSLIKTLMVLRTLHYFADRQITDELHDGLSSWWKSVLAIGLVLVTAHFGKHHVWSDS